MANASPSMFGPSSLPALKTEGRDVPTLKPDFGAAQMCFIDPFAECPASPPYQRKMPRRRPNKPTSPTRRPNTPTSPTRMRSSSMSSIGTLVTQSSQPKSKPSVSGMKFCKTAIPFDVMKGVSSDELKNRKISLQDVKFGKWTQKKRDLPSEISKQLERAFVSGQLKCALWDNGRFRDFDLGKMQEMPGALMVQRVEAGRPSTTPV